MVRYLWFGGLYTRDYKGIVDGSQTYKGPDRDVEAVSIPGRNGNLTVDNGRYLNVDITYTVHFRSSKQLEAFREKALMLNGYQRLEDSKRPDEYRLARLKSFTPVISGVENRNGAVDIVFDCMPQRFLKSGEEPIEILSTATVANEWAAPALPLIRVYGAGELTVGGLILTILAHGYDYMDIDSELGDAYCNGENLNSYLQRTRDNMEFPVLGAGDTVITAGAGISKLILYPRWWKL